jgi:hypothetical protein
VLCDREDDARVHGIWHGRDTGYKRATTHGIDILRGRAGTKFEWRQTIEFLISLTSQPYTSVKARGVIAISTRVGVENEATEPKQ